MKNMNIIKVALTTLCTVMFAVGLATFASIKVEAAKNEEVIFQVSSHVADFGDFGAEENRAGRDGKRLEGITIECKEYSKDFSYRVKNSKGFSDWKSHGQFAGSVGKSDAITEIQVKLKGKLAKKYECLLRVDLSHDIGFTSWGKNVAGSRVQPYYIEQVELSLNPKGREIKKDSEFPSVLCISPYEKVMFPLQTLNVTQLSYESFSHSNTNGIDCVGESILSAPYTGHISYFSRDYGYCVYTSEEPVELANGEVSYLSMTLLHGGNLGELENLYSSQEVIPQGTPFYVMSGTSKGGKIAFPNHYEIRITRGLKNQVTRGDVYPFEAFYLSADTNVVNAGVMEKGNYMANNAPSDYQNLWVWTQKIPSGGTSIDKKAVVKTHNALRRTGPAETYPVITKLPHKSTLDISAYVKNQYGNTFYYDGQGWIYSEHLELSSKDNTATQIRVSNISLPTCIEYGNIFVLKAHIESPAGIVSIKCVDSKGKIVFEGKDSTSGTYEVKGSTLDRLAVFNHMPRGRNYKLYLYFNDKEIASCKFDIK